MKKKLIRKLMRAIAVAGGILAGSVNSYAQTTTPPPADGAVSNGGNSGTRPAPTNPPTTTPGDGTGGGGSSGTAPGTVAPVPMPVPMPRPDGTVPPPSGGIVTPPINPDRTPIVVPPAGPTQPPRTGNVTLVGAPTTRPLPTGVVTTLPVPANPTAPNSGVTVFAGDIVRVSPGESTPVNVPSATTPVLTLVQQFDAQRTQELAARATVLNQLRTATPDERTAIIAEMQATAQLQAVEQREAARELRNEMRAMREERKGR